MTTVDSTKNSVQNKYDLWPQERTFLKPVFNQNYQKQRNKNTSANNTHRPNIKFNFALC